MKWHTLSIDYVLNLFNTNSLLGLKDEEANLRLAKRGSNTIPSPKTISKLSIALDQFRNPLVIILLIATALTAYIKDIPDTIILLTTILINTSLGYLQEVKTSEIIRKLRNHTVYKAHVIRDGKDKEILEKDIAEGDIIVLKPGYRVPADGRLIQVNNLEINEAILTGEWLAVKKDIQELGEDTPLAERSSLVFANTIIENGEGLAVVFATGQNTEIGKIISLTTELEIEKTPYQKKLAHFAKLISIVVAILAIAIFSIGVASNKEIGDMILLSLALSVAAVPEGLPMAMTIILTTSSQAILKKYGLVRKLASAEILGSTSVILTDKTGTLTEAKMQVSEIFNSHSLLSKNNGELFSDSNLSEESRSVLQMALKAINGAFIENLDQPASQWIIRGKPVEKSIIEAGIKAGLIYQGGIFREQVISKIIFNPALKYSASTYKNDLDQTTTYYLGSPEIILEKSKWLKSEEQILDTELKNQISDQINLTASSGKRVLAIALASDKNYDALIFQGLITLADNIREEVLETIKVFTSSGIKTIVVTGDNKGTAKYIANACGLDVKDGEIMSGIELDNLSDADLELIVEKIRIFARVTPFHKLRIVSAWQKRGEIVAMIGDGVNDAPAIKKADIGIAVGSGTDAAKEASDFILLKDSFAILQTAIKEGRKVLDNIRKIITYLLSDSLTEMILVVFAIGFNLPIPITAVQILWINLIEDGFPNIALALEKAEKDVMERPLSRERILITKEMKGLIFIIGIATNIFLIATFIFMINKNYDLQVIQTMMFTLLGLNSLFYVLSCRNLRKNIWQNNILDNKLLITSIITGFIALLLAIYFKPIANILHTTPLPLSFWPFIIIVSLLNTVLIEASKYYFIKNKLTEV